MPRYQTLQPDEIEYVKKQGLDPEKYLYDAEGQQLISREDAPDLTLMESGLETLKAVGGGFLSGVAGIPRGVEKFATVVPRSKAVGLEEAVRRGFLSDSPTVQQWIGRYKEPDIAMRGLTKLAEGIESLKPDVDPRLGWLPRMTGEFGGTAASLLIPGGAARYLGAGSKAAGALTTGLAGSQIFGNVSAAEEARQKAAGETPSDTKEILKAAGVTGAMLPLYHLLGPSRFFNSTAPASSIGELGKRVGVHALSGGGLAGTQRALEDAVIAGEVNPADIGKSIVAGGLAQGLTGAGAEYYSARNAPPAAKATVDVDSAPVPPAQPQAPKPKVLPEVTRLTDEQVDVLLRLPPGELPPNNGPVHKAIDKGKAEGWVRTPEDVRVLEDAVISAPKDQADTALKSAMDGLWYKNVANRPAASAEEAARNIQAGYYEFFNETFPREVKELSAGRKNLEGMRKWVEKLQKDAVKAQETGQLGFATDAQTQMQAALENIKRAETDVRAKEMELLRQWNAKHAPVPPKMGLPVVADKSGVRVGGTPPEYTGPVAGPRSVIEGEVIEGPSNRGTALPAPNVPLQLAERAGESSADYVRRVGIEAIARARAEGKKFSPEIEDTLRGYREQQEGEQGSPFGEQTRYSSMIPPSLVEVMRLGKKKRPSGLVESRPRDTVYRTAEPVNAEENLAEFKKDSTVQEPVFHITDAPYGIKNDIFNVGDNPNELGTHFGTLETVHNLKRNRKSVAQKEDAQIYPVHLSIKNPVRLPDIFPLTDWATDIDGAVAGMDAVGTPKPAKDLIVDWMQRAAKGEVDSTQDLRIALRKAGYDGVVYQNAAEGGGDSWIVFDPRQVKSATGNAGTYNPDNPSMMYSTLGLTREQVAKISEFFSKVIKNPDFAKRDPFSMVSRAVTSRMAGLSPSGGMMKWVFDGKLRPMRDAYSNELTARAQEFESFVKSAEGKAWIERSNSTGTWDFAGLTPEQAKQAQALVDTIEWTRDNATAKGVWVKDIDNAGNVTYRPGEKQPGWFPFMPSDKVYEAAARDNAEWKQFKKDFISHWEAQRGPNSTDQSLDALRHFIPSLDNGVGGEPLFSPLILPAGMTLPESWRSENLMDSWNRYARRYAQHMSWAENIQNDPVGRRLFGLQENGKGEKDTAEITWADVPDAWKYSVREGRRVWARWALAADPNKPPSALIEPFMESGLMRDMMAGYRQGNSSAPLLQAGSAATSAMILGIISGVRDVGMSTVLSGTYGEYGKTIRSVVDYLADPKGEKAKARAAGAMQADLLSPEVAATGRTMGQALLTVAQKLRRLGGPISREELDNMGRVVIFETARRLILEGRPSGKALVEEFGPAYTAGLTPEQIADQTAARLSSRQSGTSDPSNLPGWMLPQTGNPLGHFFALGRWSAARYNNFVEDTWNPFLNGKKKESAERFFKLALGGLVVSSAIQGLVNVLFDRKPDHLTWGEFLNIMDDPKIPAGKKATEAAYLMAANTQLLGSFGWVGDLVLAGVRESAGGNTRGKPLDTQYPALIFANQMYNTVTSYLDALRDGRANLGINDLTALMWEIAKGAQNGKMAARLAELAGVKDVAEKREIRNQRVYERILGQQTGSARPVAPGTAREIPSVTDPFAAQNRFLNMAPERFGEYSEFLLGRRRGGSPYQLQANWLQHPSYYGNLARITGEKAAEEEKKRDRAMEQEILRRNAALLKVK